MKNSYMDTRKKLSLTLLVVITFLSAFVISCKKENGGDVPPPPPPQDPPAPTVLLKEIVIPNLPSPYYHFEYDQTGKPKFVSFASDLTRYDIIYDGNRIIEMRNNSLGNLDTVRYFYDNSGRAIAVNYIDIAGNVYIKVALTYDGQKLIKLERRRMLGGEFVLNKVLSFIYYNDGNLKQVTDHRPFVKDRQPESTDILRYEEYDSNVNADAFQILHLDFFDHLVLLPGVRLQKNNARKEIFTGFNSYTAQYTYSYDEKHQPLTKTGDVLFTGGPEAGRRFQTNATYTYY